MDPKQNHEKTTPSKSLFTSVHGKLAHSTFNSESPFRRLPNFSTPPSRLAKITNPFEPHLSERLHTHFFSPSVFGVSSPKTEEKFKWSIDDLSILKPAPIDETTIEQYEQTDHDSVMESCAQAKIDQFFSTDVVPSPFNSDVNSAPLISESTSPFNRNKLTYSHGVAQTVLTLPPKLPEHIENVLKPYFSYTVNQQQGEVNANTSLYRKLFAFDGNDNDSGSIHSSPPRSLHLSPMTPLPNGLHNLDADNKFESSFKLDECTLSPIEVNSSYNYRERRSMTRLNFSGHMSVDNSINVVPDTCSRLPKNESVNFDSTSSPARELLSDSTVHWDLEYKHILIQSPSKYDNPMDVSNSNTPKSKIFTSQRKKLSDSFLREDDFENKENMLDEFFIENEVAKMRQTSADAGYQTGFHNEDSEWCNDSYLFASTPTKNKM